MLSSVLTFKIPWALASIQEQERGISMWVVQGSGLEIMPLPFVATPIYMQGRLGNVLSSVCAEEKKDMDLVNRETVSATSTVRRGETRAGVVTGGEVRVEPASCKGCELSQWSVTLLTKGFQCTTFKPRGNSCTAYPVVPPPPLVWPWMCGHVISSGH